MNYNDMVPEVEQTTVCPYNKSHVVLNFRFNNHLIKCRKHYTGEDLETCPFNSSHIIPKPEFYFHKKTCIDRKNVLNFIQSDKIEEPKEEKKVVDWEEMEELETKVRKLSESSELLTSSGADLCDSELNLDDFEKNLSEDRGDRHGYDNEDEEKNNNNPYNPMAHLKSSLNLSNNQNFDGSDRHSVHSNHHDDTNLMSSIQNIEDVPQKQKKVLLGWSDDEDDVPQNNNNFDRNIYKDSQNEGRNYRESSTDSFRSTQIYFHQNKKTSRLSRNHSKSPYNTRSQNSPYNRPENSQYRGTSRESNSNVSTPCRSTRHQRFDRHDRRSHGSRESEGNNREFSRDSRSREPSRNRESSVGYNQNRFGKDRQNSNNFNANGYDNRSEDSEGHQSHSNGRFGNENSENLNNFEDDCFRVIETINNHPQNDENSQNHQEDLPETQRKRKLADWSDEEDDVPESYKPNQNLPQNPPNFNSSSQNSNSNLLFEASNPQETEKRKLQEWSDDEDDVTPSIANKNTKYDSERWDDNANEIDFSDKIPITKSKKSRRYFSDRPSDEKILERFEKLSPFKNFLFVDSWFDKRYRGKMDVGMFN